MFKLVPTSENSSFVLDFVKTSYFAKLDIKNFVATLRRRFKTKIGCRIVALNANILVNLQDFLTKCWFAIL
jgi:hypothetical protein